MFWETCAKHSFEILAALIGSGILGYLFSRWFGRSEARTIDNSAYESQIRSLRDRIKQQDIDLQKARLVVASQRSACYVHLLLFQTPNESMDAHLSLDQICLIANHWL